MHKQSACIILSVLLFLFSNAQKSVKSNTDNKHNHHTNDFKSIIGYADSVNLGYIAEDTLKGSLARKVAETIGQTKINIKYHSPGVKGRIIWGGLVPFETVWVTGAHSATSLSINKPIVINKQKIEAGTYAIFTIPSKEKWTFILNKNYQQHLTDNYSEKDDVLRFIVYPEENPLTQRLTYLVTKNSNTEGNIEILWEKIKIKVPFQVF